MRRDTRSIALSPAVRREKTIFGKIVQALIENPGRIRPVATALKVSTKAVYSASRAYVNGVKWVPGSQGGRPLLMSEETRQQLIAEVEHRISANERPSFDDMAEMVRHCLAMAHAEKQARASILGVTPIAETLEQCQLEFSDSWLYQLIKECGFRLATPSSVTYERSQASRRSNIRHWFRMTYTSEIASMFRSATVFNADEMNLEFDMQQKVLSRRSEKRAPDQDHLNFNGHMTVMVTVSCGTRIPPQLFLVGGNGPIPNLSHVIDGEFVKIQSGGSGWMTKSVFEYYSEVFVQWVKKQRDNGYFTKTEPILLFLDGHGSRGSCRALDNFRSGNVMVITFPGQVTHIMQPIDVGLAAPWRVYFRRALRGLKLRKKEQTPDGRLCEKDKRALALQAANEACQQTLTCSNIQASFLTTGIWPRNVDKTLESPYVVDDDSNPEYPDGRCTARSLVSGKIVTSDAVFSAIVEHERKTLRRQISGTASVNSIQ